MILLVVGLVAVIVVILIAVFLSIRLGRGDEHDDETDIRPSSRSRRADEDRWREPDTRDTRRSSGASRPGRGSGERYGTDDRRRGAAASAGWGPAREREHAGRNSAGRNSAGRNSAGRNSAGRNSAGRNSDRDYDTGPRRPARRDTDGYSTPARPRPAASASAEGRGRSATGPQRRIAADDFPSGDYGAMDFPSGEFPTTVHQDDFPSGELPAATSRPTRARSEARTDSERTDSRRKAAPPAPSKSSRSPRQRGKRDDDTDWGSSDWDKLSDEQYWAELSADKPLSAMAKPAKPKAPVAEHGEREARQARSARKPAPAAEREQDRESRSRRERPQQREREPVTPQREAVTERLPVRARQQPAVPAARMAADRAAGRSLPTGAHPSLDIDLPSARNTGPQSYSGSVGNGAHAAPSTGRHPSLDTAPYTSRNGGRHPSLDTGLPSARNTGPQSYSGSVGNGAHAAPSSGHHPSLDTSDPNLAMLRGLAGATPPPIPGALQDDPLTSPSFSLKDGPTTDSRSYSQAKKAARTAGNGSGQPSADPLATGPSHSTGGHSAGGHSTGGHSTGGHDSGAYPATSYPQAPAAYSYPAEPPVPAAAASADWYGAPPPEQPVTPAYGNPYSYPGVNPAGSPPGAAGDPGYGGGYLADPLRVYAPPPYESAPASTYPDPASAPYQGLPALGMTSPAMETTAQVPYQESYPQHPYPQPEQPQYTDGYGGGYQPGGYEGGYPADPYASGGYGTYPQHG